MIVHTGLAVKFIAISNRGDINQERVHLEVMRDVNAATYLLMATVAINAERVYAGLRPAYWFESQELREGDHVIVYTKQGVYSRDIRMDGHFNHFFYWGAKESLFTIPAARVIVAEMNAWNVGM